MAKRKPKTDTDIHSFSQPMDPPLLDRLKTCKSLPALPPIASKILKMCRSDDADAEKLAGLIGQDPAMVTRLLHVANSGYYGGSRHKVVGIVQAVTLLGMNAIGTLALSFCFYRLFRDLQGSKQTGFDHTAFWRRSILASVAGRELSKLNRVNDGEVVFLGALLQDIGILAMNELLPGIVGNLMKEAEGNHTHLQELEKTYLGCDHTQIGSWLAELWQLPEEFQWCIGASHAPTAPSNLSPDQDKMVKCVALSGQVADIWCCPHTEQTVNEAAQGAMTWLEMSPESLMTILDQVIESLSEVAGFFQIQLGNPEEYKGVLRIARDNLIAVPTPTT